MSLNKLYRTDKSRELEGLTVEYVDTEGNLLAWFKCKRPGGRNHNYNLALSRKLRQNRKALHKASDAEKEEILRKIQAEVYAETIVTDWGGDLEGPNGESPMECTRDNIYWLFADDCPDLFDNLQARLNLQSLWTEEADEEVS